MDPRQFLFVYGFLVVLLAGSFFVIRRGSRSPSRLRMINDRAKGSRFGSKLQKASQSRPEKNLNAIFNYNGHSWDAYEVLGVPAGSSFEAVEKAYHDLVSRTPSDSVEFINSAFKSIQSQKP